MSEKWKTNLVQGVRRWPPRDRNWPVVRVLAAVSVVLFAAGTLTEFGLVERDRANLYHMAAVAFGAVVVLFHQDRRLFVDRPPA